MGTSMHCELPPSSVQSNLKQYADIIAQELKITGAWFFQVKMDIEGTLKLLEVEARIAGTMALNRVRGVNFPLLSLYQAAGLPVKISCNEYDVSIDRSLQNRYLHNVDLDDTLLIKNKINIDLIRFLYQCLNRQIKITLLSKSLATDKIELLKKFRIENLFDEIIWLKETDNKADYIKNNPAIFIDDSFSQRLTVQEQCKIATFDCSMIEMLMDERI